MALELLHDVLKTAILINSKVKIDIHVLVFCCQKSICFLHRLVLVYGKTNDQLEVSDIHVGTICICLWTVHAFFTGTFIIITGGRKVFEVYHQQFGTPHKIISSAL